MLAEVLVWKEMVILFGLKNGEGKIFVAEMIESRISQYAYISLSTYTKVCVILYRMFPIFVFVRFAYF